MNKKQKKMFVLCFGVLFFLSLCFVNARTVMAAAAEFDSIYIDEVHLVKGELVVIKVYGLSRLSMTDPNVVDIQEAEENEILLIAQDFGQTTLFIWDDHGKRSIAIHVSARDLKTIRIRLEKLLKTADISEVSVDTNIKEGMLIVFGEVPEYKEDQFNQIIENFSESIINLAKKEEPEELIEINMQITEHNISFTKNLGIEWFTGTQTSSDTAVTTVSGGALNPTFMELLPDRDGSVGDYFKVGKFVRTNESALLASINILLEEGKAKLISKPRLVVVSGEEASFLVGGEIPIRTTTTGSSGATQENVTFKSYGVGMTLTPTLKKGKIDIVLNVNISDVDLSNAVGGNVAFVTRSASTRLFLDNNQTIVLAGLIKKNRATAIKRVPFISNIPVVGALFRNKRTPSPDIDQELVIALTPNLLVQEETQMKENTAFLYNEEVSVEKSSKAGSNQTKGYFLSGAPEDMEEYIQTVQQKIARAFVYPPEAVNQDWEGTVKVGMLILKDGTLAFALVKESSGYEIFDQEALRIAKSSAPYESFPLDTDLQEINVTVPIVYKKQ
ncbi:Type II/IV secretion system secretin RcpA/CpaC, associated with Flp pilus assembly [hydrothermal vent metagenome]|uniref:Type II/IV secretion system secretin RcpA/CpaC, associated with Flp pilus assembly n=1 Tax=hydrothermal vent metagenome TaxID=652676 RepID=A0A3B1D5I4_9ZZZZ